MTTFSQIQQQVHDNRSNIKSYYNIQNIHTKEPQLHINMIFDEAIISNHLLNILVLTRFTTKLNL